VRRNGASSVKSEAIAQVLVKRANCKNFGLADRQNGIFKSRLHSTIRNFISETSYRSGEFMLLITLATFLKPANTVVGACAAGIALFLIGVFAVRKEIAEARGLAKIVALSNLCFAVPLAVFGAEHLFSAQFIMNDVPAYMPGRLFLAYFVGCALIAASLSIATRLGVRWSGLLFGIMMFLFVAMLHIPRALVNPHARIPWMIVFREMSFGGAGWVLAGNAMDGWRGQGKSRLITVGRILIGITAIVFGIEHFLHATGLPGVPLLKEIPTWMPARVLIDYVTGAGLLVAGVCFLLARKVRMAATYLGGWILLMVLVIYGPVLVSALSDASAAVQIEGINYFADTLFFSGVILTLASTTPKSE
jgi:uncharacterized membrane protein YphA (DoxX/SURF4 family)